MKEASRVMQKRRASKWVVLVLKQLKMMGRENRLEICRARVMIKIYVMVSTE